MNKGYKLEVWATIICFVLIAVTGGFLSVYFVIANESYFEVTAPPPGLDEKLGEETAQRIEDKGNFFIAETEKYILGFPRHYFLLVMFSWLGATLIGVVWSVLMDRLEAIQRS